MAVTHVTFGRLASDIGTGEGPAFDVEGASTEALTPSGTAAATTITAPRGGQGSKALARVVTDTTVYVSFGTAPVASSDTVKFLVLANTDYHWYVPSGWKASVVTA